jgi:hypothetical protein
VFNYLENNSLDLLHSRSRFSELSFERFIRRDHESCAFSNGLFSLDTGSVLFFGCLVNVYVNIFVYVLSVIHAGISI